MPVVIRGWRLPEAFQLRSCLKAVDLGVRCCTRAARGLSRMDGGVLPRNLWWMKPKKTAPLRRRISFAVDRDEIEINSDWVDAETGIPKRQCA